MTFSETLSKLDPDLATAIESEQKRQEEHIELIASENYTSSEVMEIQGSVLTNKYAEGYPGRRYYGCLLYTSPSPRDLSTSRMPSSA